MGYRMGGNLWGSATHWNSTAAAAGQAAHPVAQDAILLEGDDPLAVLPAQSKIVNAAVVAALDGQLLCVHVYPSLSATHIFSSIPATSDARIGQNRPPMTPASEIPQSLAPPRFAGRCDRLEGRLRPPAFILHSNRPLVSPEHFTLGEPDAWGTQPAHRALQLGWGVYPTRIVIATHSSPQAAQRRSHALCALSGGTNSTPDFSACC